MDNLGLSDFEKLKNFVKERELDFVSEMKPSHSSPTDFALFVPGDRVAAKSGKGMTSHHQMKLLQKAVKQKLGFNIEWVVTQGEQAPALETALKQLIEAHHPGCVGAIYVSSPKLQPLSRGESYANGPRTQAGKFSAAKTMPARADGGNLGSPCAWAIRAIPLRRGFRRGHAGGISPAQSR